MSVRRIGGGAIGCFAIPGWGEDAGSFSPLEEHLCGIATIYAADPPGYGSAPAPHRYTVDEITARLENSYSAACEMHGDRLGIFLGNCSGAILASELAMRVASPPARLLLVDPFAFLPGYFRIFLKRGFGRHAYNSTFANPVGRWVTNQLVSGREERSTDMTGSFRVVDHEVTYRYLEMFGRIRGISRFRDLRSEVVIVTGERTFAAVKRSIDMWQELWPHAHVATIPGCGHLPIKEAPGRLVSELILQRTAMCEASDA